MKDGIFGIKRQSLYEVTERLKTTPDAEKSGGDSFVFGRLFDTAET